MAGHYEETAPLTQRKRLSAQQLLKNDRSQRKARRLGIDIDYDVQIRPHIAKVPPYALIELTGVSKAHAYKIRRGFNRPQPSHWPALLELVKAAADGTPTRNAKRVKQDKPEDRG